MIRILDNDNLSVIFEHASPLRVDVTEEKQVTRYRVEDGSERSDHVIDKAREIVIEFALSQNYKAQFQEIKTYYEVQKLVTVQCNMDTYLNMLIEAMPHTESASMVEGTIIPMRFVEWREVIPEYGELLIEKVKRPEMASTIDRGEVEEEKPPRQSLLRRLFGKKQ